MLPTSGPIALSIPGISGVSVPANTTGTLIPFRWPQTMRLGGLDFVLRSGSNVQLANTNLRMLDVDSNELALDGFGFKTSAPGLALRGNPGIGFTFGGRMAAFQRIVRCGDIWRFQIINDNGAAVVPELWFRLERVVTVYEGRAA